LKSHEKGLLTIYQKINKREGSFAIVPQRSEERKDKKRKEI